MRIDYTGQIFLDDDIYENFIYLEEGEFELKYLSKEHKSNKGASSSIFILSDPSGSTEEMVIKICKTKLGSNDQKSKKKIQRFKREITAFSKVKKSKISGVIEYYGNGVVEIKGEKFLYIILEKAECDLAEFLKKNHFNFTNSQKLSFCATIVEHFKNLHGIGIYHRDIKHDNIFYLNGEFKIGDLGLIDFQDKDFVIDSIDEKIGPIGWLVPEATNKMLCKNNSIYKFDCIIDAKSDVFQLGKLFWYIFQGNLPLGQLEQADALFNDEEIYTVIYGMLQYNKERRPDLEIVSSNFAPIKLRLFV